MPKEETQEISLRLQHYDDIFSDFDMRHYSKRALSVDFVDEVRRASLDKKEPELELALYVPQAIKNESHEATIRERLGQHFEKHYGLLLANKRRTLRQGWFMVFLGVICMLAATLIVFEDPTHSTFFLSFLVVFLEPAAWFLLWEGMDQVIFTSNNINPELNFYKKMFASHRNIHFRFY